eukprot:6197419-Pleurochrysis_carterae.AAC.1
MPQHSALFGPTTLIGAVPICPRLRRIARWNWTSMACHSRLVFVQPGIIARRGHSSFLQVPTCDQPSDNPSPTYHDMAANVQYPDLILSIVGPPPLNTQQLVLGVVKSGNKHYLYGVRATLL